MYLNKCHQDRTVITILMVSAHTVFVYCISIDKYTSFNCL